MNTENVHKVFGRGTNMGRMLHKLYNASNERNSYEPNVTLTLKPSDPINEHKLRLEQIRNEIRSKKKTVHIPKKRKSVKPIPKILLLKGRKSRKEIIDEMDKNYDQINQIPAHIPTKPRCEQINDLQSLMECGQRPRKIKRSKIVKPTQKKTKSINKELENRMTELLNEINERQTFLKSMQQINTKNYKEYEAQINVQIAQKCKEFKQIDAFLRS